MIGISFSDGLLPLVMDGTKTQTRRVMMGPWDESLMPVKVPQGYCFPETSGLRRNRYGSAGSLLYVKENLYLDQDDDCWRYRTDDALVMVDKSNESAMLIWAHHKVNTYQSSRFMPKWAARTFLRLTEIRVERLQSITEEDAIAEGFPPHMEYSYIPGEAVMQPEREVGAVEQFQNVWNSINRKNDPWLADPWCWCLTFERVEGVNNV